MKKLLFLTLAIATVTSTSCSKNNEVKTPADIAGSQPSVNLIMWNDFHSSLYEAVQKNQPDQASGGLPVWMAAVEALKTDGPNLLLDAGDMFQGATPLNQMEGLGMAEIMNAVGLDVTTFGNHEFDYYTSEKQPNNPQGALTDTMNASNFDWVNVNVVSSSADNPYWPPQKLKPYTILQKGPYRIAVTGITTVETAFATSACNSEGIQFDNVAQSLASVIPEIVAQNPDFIIVLGHLSGEPTPMPEFGQITSTATFDNEIAEILALPEDIRKHIGLLVTGHLHISFLYDDGTTVITQGKSAGRELTRMTLVPRKDGHGLTIDRSSIQKYALTHRPIYRGCDGGYEQPESLQVGDLSLTPDSRGFEMVTRFESYMQESMCDIVACTTEPFIRNSSGESAIGNLIVDATRSPFPEADGAILNAGGLRIDWPKGDLNREKIVAIMPFDNKAFLIDMTGDEILRILKHSSTGAHGAMQVSGISYSYQPDCGRAPEDINNNGNVENWETNCLCEGATINGKPIRPDEHYKIVLSDFLFNGGDNLKGIFKQSRIIAEGPVIKKTIADYVSSHEGCYSISELVSESAPRISHTTCSAFEK